MRTSKLAVLIVSWTTTSLLLSNKVEAFSARSRNSGLSPAALTLRSPLWSLPATPMTSSAPDGEPRTENEMAPVSLNGEASAAVAKSSNDDVSEKQKRKLAVRRDGGLFAFDTKFGALNPYGIFWGLTAIVLGIPWFLSQMFCLVLYKFAPNIDPKRRLSIFFTHIWGVSLLTLTGCMPQIVNKHILDQYYKKKRPAMFVANHSSWMDIPVLGAAIGWRNYKIVAKEELLKVPVLGSSIAQGGHITVARADRRSQLETLKKGIDYLKSSVNLVTYPEGTRSRDGRLAPFKNGAFKMAQKAGAPVIPVSIVGAFKVQPYYWMFPFRASRNVIKVVIHEPIDSSGKTEKELAEEVRQSMISGLAKDQLPLSGK